MADLPYVVLLQENNNYFFQQRDVDDDDYNVKRFHGLSVHRSNSMYF